VAQPKGKGVPHSRLQLGYFSVEENAQALKDELTSKGFAAAVEERLRPDKSGGEVKRWIVSVESGTDLAKTIQKLKDAGYEAYTIE
jgi:cell division protein FtsN